MIYLLQYANDRGYIEIVRDIGVDRIYQISILAFLDAWCMQYGSTMEGRRITCAKHLGIQQKVPILISERTHDIMFPTRNVKEDTCVWLNYRFIDYIKGNHKQTSVYFVNGEMYTVYVDQRIIKRGMRLCKEYLQVLQSFL